MTTARQASIRPSGLNSKALPPQCAYIRALAEWTAELALAVNLSLQIFHSVADLQG
jgi:hypothetical protein